MSFTRSRSTYRCRQRVPSSSLIWDIIAGRNSMKWKFLLARWSVAYICRDVCVFVCSITTLHSSKAIFTRLHTQAGTSTGKNFKVTWSEVKVMHAAMIMEILWSRWILNCWMDLNQDLHKYLIYFYVLRSWGQRSRSYSKDYGILASRRSLIDFLFAEW